MPSLGEMHFVMCGLPAFWNQFDPTGSGMSNSFGIAVTLSGDLPVTIKLLFTDYAVKRWV
jgi:hypothetical protein